MSLKEELQAMSPSYADKRAFTEAFLEQHLPAEKCDYLVDCWVRSLNEYEDSLMVQAKLGYWRHQQAPHSRHREDPVRMRFFVEWFLRLGFDVSYYEHSQLINISWKPEATVGKDKNHAAG
jgi:hypothetical protein